MGSASTKWLAGVVVVVVGLIVVSVVVAAMGAGNEPVLLPETQPEGVVQRYLLAVDANETEKAYGYISPTLKGYCTVQHFRDSSQYIREQDMRISLSRTEVIDGVTFVDVRVTQTRVNAEIPFTPRESSSTQRFSLQPVDGVWRFIDPPWPMSWCPGLERVPGKPGRAPFQPAATPMVVTATPTAMPTLTPTAATPR